MKRVTAYQDLEAHKQDVGLQQYLAEQAYGNGGVWGMGLAMEWSNK